MNSHFNSNRHGVMKRLVSASVCSVVALGASLGAALATSADAGAAPSLQGTACTYPANYVGYGSHGGWVPCADTIAGAGFTPGAQLDVQVWKSTGPNAGSPEYVTIFESTTTATQSSLVPGHCFGLPTHQICTPNLVLPGGTFSLTFWNSMETTCGQTATFTISVKQLHAYGLPEQATYNSVTTCGWG